MADQEIPVLDQLNMEILPGEFVAIMGSSGSGKSTLLHILGCLDHPSAGLYRLAGRNMDGLGDSVLSRVRAEEIGFIFQKFFLLPQLSVFENVKYPFLYSPRVASQDIPQRVSDVLSQVGLLHRATHRPSELSGGEMQRVAIARALVTRPKLILADEPTGSLDAVTGNGILELLKKINEDGTTILLVTHDSRVASWADRTLLLKGGRFAS